MENRDIVFEIKEQIGVIEEFQTGWMKELNLVSWNGNEPKYDIRDWDEKHERMSRGITLTEEQMNKVYKMLIDRNRAKGHEVPNQKKRDTGLER